MYAKNIHCARFDTRRYHSDRETHFNVRVEKNNENVTGARNVGHGQRVTVQGYAKNIIRARAGTRRYHSYIKTHFNARSTQNYDKITGARNVGRGHRVMVISEMVC